MEVLRVICFLLFLLSLPLLAAIAVFFVIVRRVLSIYLLSQYGPRFRGFVEGQDVIYAMCDDKARGIINVMAFVVVAEEDFNPQTSAHELLGQLRDRFEGALRRRAFEKLFFERRFKLGYYFWLQKEAPDIHDYVRLVTLESETDFVSRETLGKAVSEMSNAKLPEDNSCNWELLVASKPIQGTKVVKFPVFLRVSHAVGDGVSLLRMFFEEIADRKAEEPKYPFVSQQQQSFLSQLWYWTRLVYLAPFHILHTIFFKPVDENSLHPEAFSGEKVAFWAHEQDLKTPLLDTLRAVRRKFPGTRFNEVCSTVLSKALQKSFPAMGQRTPKTVTLLVPELIFPIGPEIELRNNFSVALQTLPLEQGEFPDLLSEVKRFSRQNFSGLEFHVNYWGIQYFPSYLPRPITARIFRSDQSSIGLSVLPGPSEAYRICGHEIQDVTFWLPNVGRVGVCISLFSYDQKLQLGIVADRRALRTEEEAALVLNSVIEEISRLTIYS